MIHEPEEVVARSLKLATEGRVYSVDGEEIEFQADTICLHGDTQGAVQLAASVRSELESAGVQITSPGLGKKFCDISKPVKLAITARCATSAPFGGPVVPEV